MKVLRHYRLPHFADSRSAKTRAVDVPSDARPKRVIMRRCCFVPGLWFVCRPRSCSRSIARGRRVRTEACHQRQLISVLPLSDY